MLESQNGWEAFSNRDSRYLYDWVIPASTGHFTLRLRQGSAGFLIAHYALWYAEKIETVAGKGDDFGWDFRAISGSNVYSNHASGTAVDLNASTRPQGRYTLTKVQRARIALRLKFYRGCLRSGAFYNSTVDEMHTEIDRDLSACESLARLLMKAGRGKRIIKANPKQKSVILA